MQCSASRNLPAHHCAPIAIHLNVLVGQLCLEKGEPEGRAGHGHLEMLSIEKRRLAEGRYIDVLSLHDHIRLCALDSRH